MEVQIHLTKLLKAVLVGLGIVAFLVGVSGGWTMANDYLKQSAQHLDSR